VEFTCGSVERSFARYKTGSQSLSSRPIYKGQDAGLVPRRGRDGRGAIVGRGSLTDSFPIFGFDLADYETLFGEKLDLLTRLLRNQP
jgi:hypothetical protein